MKKIIFITIMIIISIFPLVSQVDFSGSANISIGANIPESEDYNSLLNPSNIMELKDIGISSSFIGKLDAGDDKTTFSAWLALKEYPIGQALLTAAYGDTVQVGGVSELTKTLGDTIFTLDLMRLSVNIYLADSFSMEIGRQSMLTGYGYGWNPIDFANPLKNPTDPDADMRGVDGISLKFFFGNVAALKIYGILPEDLLSSGLDYEEIKAGGELTLNFSGLEIKADGFFDYDASSGSDSYTPSLGVGLMLDFFGVGVYGEGAVRKGSRNNFTDGGSNLYRKDDWLFSGLIGLEYTFPIELYVVIEYFYNGEGYNESERSLYESSVIAAGAPTSDLYNIYSPGYFAKHYIMLNLMQPIYDINLDLNLSVLLSPDSGALTVMPSLGYNFSGNFYGKLSYTGMFDIDENDFSEVSALPVKHVVSTTFTYSF